MITNINPQPPTSARKHRRRLAVAGVSAMAVMAAAVSLSGVASASTPTKSNRTFKTADGHSANHRST
jgi:hypothetical protein